MTEHGGREALSLINPPGLYDPTPNGYSHVAVLPPGARMAFIAGQGGETADGRLSEDFRDQVRQALRNLCIAIAIVMNSNSVSLCLDVLRVSDCGASQPAMA